MQDKNLYKFILGGIVHHFCLLFITGVSLGQPTLRGRDYTRLQILRDQNYYLHPQVMYHTRIKCF